MSVCLVTGATGFLGSALTVRLLEQGRPVRCVVRGATDAERRARLLAALGPVRPGGVEVVPGDLAQERLGLAPDAFAALGDGVTHVFHSAARVNMALPYESLHATNVRATEDLLDLAASSSAAFCYVGSMAAVAHGVTDEPFELTRPVAGGYAQSKWSADRLVSVAHEEGRVRASILRPGRITADSNTGRSNPDDLLERVIRLCVRLSAAPVLDTRVRLSPVDWVSELIIGLSGVDEAYGRAFHLVSGQTLPWAEVVTALRHAGYDVGDMPYPAWRATAVRAGRDDPETARLAGSLPTEDLAFDRRPGWRPRAAAATLADRYPQPPPAGPLLAATIAAWQRTGDLPPLGSRR